MTLNARKEAVHHDAPPDVAVATHVLAGIHPGGPLLALPLPRMAVLMVRVLPRGAYEYLAPFVALLRLMTFTPAWPLFPYLASPLRIHLAIRVPPVGPRRLPRPRVMALPPVGVPLLAPYPEEPALPLALTPPVVPLPPPLAVP